MEMTNVILLGAGEHAHVVLDSILCENRNVVAMVDPKFRKEFESRGIKIIPTYDESAFPDAKAIVAIGGNALRKSVAENCQHAFGKTVHPSAIVAKNVTIGNGCMILHGVIIQQGTVIGNHTILNTGCQVDHDCSIGDFVHIAPGVVLCGRVIVGEGSLVGAGATIIPGIKIGKWATIGAGSVVIQNIPDRAVAVGNPAKIIKYNKIA